MKPTRIILLILIIMLLIPTAVSCTQKDDTQTSDFGLFINNFVEHDGWIYYSEFDSGDLYKIKPNGENKTRIGTCQTYYFKIYKDWICYLDAKYGSMHFVTLDGNDILFEDASIGGDKFYVIDDWIYYMTKLMVIYRLKIDGTKRTVLNRGNEPCTDFHIDGDWIYFSAAKYVDNVQHSVLYKMRLDGTQRTQLSQEVGVTVDFNDKWIYYLHTEGESFLSGDAKSLFRVSLDGINTEKLTESVTRWSSFQKNIGEWMYYEDVEDNSLYKVNIENGERTKIVENLRISEISIWDNWLIYLCLDTETYEKSYLQMIRISDTHKTDTLIEQILNDMPSGIEIRKYE